MQLGRGQVSILRSTVGRWFEATDNTRYRQCLRLHARKLLSRDPKSSHRFTATAAGEALIIEHDDALAATAGSLH